MALPRKRLSNWKHQLASFDRLHPALQHHIVNSLGWRELRPFQDLVIPKAIAGEHLIILAPTAGGKTDRLSFRRYREC